ncbi:hypothetical protein DPEC_G00370030 [Dallia pectoralis]|nr:hypothetical protein DPEC_G00370030 [Dallia pectoralis]
MYLRKKYPQGAEGGVSTPTRPKDPPRDEDEVSGGDRTNTTHSIKSERRRIKWPAANMTSLWNQFDIDVDQILEATMRGVDRKLQAMTMIRMQGLCSPILVQRLQSRKPQDGYGLREEIHGGQSS